MSVKITIEVIADSLPQAFKILGNIDTSSLTVSAPAADKGDKPAAKAKAAPATAAMPATAATPIVVHAAASSPAATTTTTTADAGAAPITTGSLIQKANLAVNNANWGASLEDRKAQVMSIPKKFGASRFAEMSDPIHLAAAAQELDALINALS